MTKIAIIGGGMMGICLGYFLTQKGISVEIFEGSPALGGLAGLIQLRDGTCVDRYYHTILSSDSHLLQLCKNLGITTKLTFRDTRMGFYYHGRVHSMNNMVEFFRFPPLGWIDRFRLGLTILYAQFLHDWRKLESLRVDKWLVQLSGRTTYDNIWKPMLKAKFDGNFDNTPATYIWSRLVRMKSTRNGVNQTEKAGYLIGGYITLIKAMAEKIEAAGGIIHLQTPVDEIVIDSGRAVGIRIGNEFYSFDATVATQQVPELCRLIPNAAKDYLDYLDKTEYLGLIAPILILDRPLTGYWTLYITDENVPFTGVIETTTYIDPKYVGGYHLIYLPKYVAPDSEWQEKTDTEIREIWLKYLHAMFPGFDDSWMHYFLVHRERFVEPLHGLNQIDLIPSISAPIENLFLVNTTQIYPSLTNGESVSRHAYLAANHISQNAKAPIP